MVCNICVCLCVCVLFVFACKHVVAHRIVVSIAGPQMQSDFLYQMGIDVRFLSLLKSVSNDDMPAMQQLMNAYLTMTDNRKMGSRFKTMCISSLKEGEAPTGFELIRPIPRESDKGPLLVHSRKVE